MKHLYKKPIVRRTVATVIIILGVAGIPLPVIPGTILIGVGLYIFSLDSLFLREKIHHYRTKHRVLDHALKHSYDKLHAKRNVSKEV